MKVRSVADLIKCSFSWIYICIAVHGDCLSVALKLNFLRFVIKFEEVTGVNTLKLFVVLLAAAIFIAACGQTATTSNQANTTANTAANSNKTSSATPVVPDAPKDEMSYAKELYQTNCMNCHRDTGKGGKVTVDGKTLDPIDLTSAKVKARTDEKLAAQVSEGSPEDGMPAFKGKLKPDEIKILVKYMRTL